MIIGSGLKQCDKIQRFANVDPHPEVPFTEQSIFSKGDAILAVCVLVGLVFTGLAAIAMFA